MNLLKVFSPLIFLSVLLLVFPQSVQAATVSLKSLTPTVKAGDNVKVDVVLNSEGANVSGVDIIILFDNAKLEMVDNQLYDLFETKVAKTVSYGQLSLQATSAAGKYFTGSNGVLGSINFKAIADGQANVQIQFVGVGDTTDSSVTIADGTGKDVLNSVVNLSVDITPATAAVKQSDPVVKTTATPVSGVFENSLLTLLFGSSLLGIGFFIKSHNQ